VAKCTQSNLDYKAVDSGGAIGGGGGRSPDSRFVTYGAPVHQVVNIYEHNLQNYAKF